jgi:hypothetical protein
MLGGVVFDGGGPGSGGCVGSNARGSRGLPSQIFNGTGRPVTAVVLASNLDGVGLQITPGGGLTRGSAARRRRARSASSLERAFIKAASIMVANLSRSACGRGMQIGAGPRTRQPASALRSAGMRAVWSGRSPSLNRSNYAPGRSPSAAPRLRPLSAAWRPRQLAWPPPRRPQGATDKRPAYRPRCRTGCRCAWVKNAVHNGRKRRSGLFSGAFCYASRGAILGFPRLIGKSAASTSRETTRQKRPRKAHCAHVTNPANPA